MSELLRENFVYNKLMFPIGLNELMIISGLCCVLVFLPLLAAILVNRNRKTKR